MNTTAVADDNHQITEESPGAELARIREKKGLTREQVASKLHLRVKLIEHLEKDEYAEMPEPVFIMGYLRAYAKLLQANPEPFVASFKNRYTTDHKPEKALWQSKRESNKGELVVRVVTALVAISAMIAIAFWWQKSREDGALAAQKNKGNFTTVLEAASLKASSTASASPSLSANASADSTPKLAQVSKLQSLFIADPIKSPVVKVNA